MGRCVSCSLLFPSFSSFQTLRCCSGRSTQHSSMQAALPSFFLCCVVALVVSFFRPSVVVVSSSSSSVFSARPSYIQKCSPENGRSFVPLSLFSPFSFSGNLSFSEVILLCREERRKKPLPSSLSLSFFLLR